MSKASITPLYARDTAGDLAGTSQGCSSLLPFLLSAQALVLAGESLCLQIYDDSPWGPGQFLLNKVTGPGVPSSSSRARCDSAVPPCAAWLKRCQAALGTGHQPCCLSERLDSPPKSHQCPRNPSEHWGSALFPHPSLRAQDRGLAAMHAVVLISALSCSSLLPGPSRLQRQPC